MAIEFSLSLITALIGMNLVVVVFALSINRTIMEYGSEETCICLQANSGGQCLRGLNQYLESGFFLSTPTGAKKEKAGILITLKTPTFIGPQLKQTFRRKCHQ